MTLDRPPHRAARYLRFLGTAVAAGAVLVLVGYPATRRLGGEGGVEAMVVACAVSVVASAVGALPVAFGSGATPADRLNRTLGAMVARLFVALLLGAAAALSGWLATGPLLIWLVISYLALLILDTVYALRVLRDPEES